MIVGIGETILDIIFKNDQPVAAVPGGSTFNALISLGRVLRPSKSPLKGDLEGDSSSLPLRGSGEGVVFVSEVGTDHVGDIIVSFLAENGVSAEYVNRRKNTKSHISLAFLDEHNDAQYQFYKDHANVSIENKFPEVKKGDIVVFGSFFAVNPVLRPLVKAFLESAYKAGAFIYYDINFRASHIDDIPFILPAIIENMKMSTVVRGSLEDFQYLYTTPEHPLSAAEVYERYIKPYCPCFICTNGGKPVELFTPALRAEFPSTPVETVSTIGAGDNFNAGFVYGVDKAYGEGKELAFDKMPVEAWQPLIAYGQRFSSAVCQSFDNYVDKDFCVS
jgi:fructokinase